MIVSSVATLSMAKATLKESGTAAEVAKMSCRRELTPVVFCMVAALLGGCHPSPRPKLFYINSYHPGHASSDALMAGMYEVIAGSRARLDVFFMDSERHGEPPALAAKTQEVLAAIREARPDVIIASDDNAVKLVIAKHFRDGPIPCVFCGVDWTCEPYGLPTDNVTGMLEVPPILEAVEILKQDHLDMKHLVVLSGNTTSEQQNQAILRSIFSEAGLATTYLLVETFDEWKRQFDKANRQADAVFLTTHSAVQNWDEAEARAFVREHMRVPVFTCDAFMMKYAVFGLTPVAREQGQWAARAALRIARGKSPAQIRVARNQQIVVYVNGTLAEHLGWQPNETLLRRPRRVD